MTEVSARQQRASQWVNNYSDALYAFALARVNDENNAKDLVQETFLAAWRNFDSYKGEASVKTWLFAILKNKIIDHYRKTSVRQFENMELIDDSFFFDEAEHWTKEASPKEWSHEAISNIETTEFYSVLNKCQSKLKDIQRQVFSMKYLDDMDSEDICSIMNISNANYWIIIHRAKVQLRACLEQNWIV